MPTRKQMSWGAVILGIIALLWGFSGCDGPARYDSGGGTMEVNITTVTGSPEATVSIKPATTNIYEPQIE